MSREYLLQRLGSLETDDDSEGAPATCLASSRGKDILWFSALFLWPAINIILVVYNYFRFELRDNHFHCKTHVLISRVAAVFGFGLYACFCFIIYKLCWSHLREFIAIANEVHEEDLTADVANDKIRRAFCTFRGFRNVVGTWTTFSIAVGTLGVFTQSSWNYGVHKSKEHPTPDETMIELMFGVMMWSEKLMFLVQPLFVIGGINADYLWRKFKRLITESFLENDQSEKLNKILVHMKRIDTSFKWIKPTVALTLVNLYLGMHLEEQELNYWIGPACYVNETVF